MKTNDLIDDLSKNLKSVKPLRGKRHRLAVLMLGAPAIVAAVFCLFPLRHDLKDAMISGLFIVGAILCLLGWVLSSYTLALFQLPTNQKKSSLLFSTGLLVLLCLTYVAWTLLGAAPGSFESGADLSGFHCTLSILILSFFSGVFLFFEMSDGASTRAVLTGLNIGLGCVLLSAFFLQFSCPSQNPVHLLIWHMFLPAVILTGVGALLGRLALKW